LNFDETGTDGLYVEASARRGKVRNDFSSYDVKDSSGTRAEYESSSAYRGFRVGGDYVLGLTTATSLDLDVKYLRTVRKGDSVTLSAGDEVTFDKATSSRTRLGGRFRGSATDVLTFYLGAAFEREFDGKAGASTNGFSVDAPSVRGNTGIGEVGVTLKASARFPPSFDLGVRCRVGKRKGLAEISR
jgi:outer membrane autotransporter protein